jgi:hypothetical protein
MNGCATPAERTEALARSRGATVTRVDAGGFEHVVISRQAAAVGTLHIYFSGDGTPWLHKTQIAADPTPRDPLELKLMLEDPTSSVYIGRPCYVGLADSPGCSPALWTDGRYSDAVVSSMVAAVEVVLAESAADRVVLIGYSGGGVLALLVAERVKRVDTVVTIAANLDIAAWTALHGYSALSTSVNPAHVSTWREGLRQIHLVGQNDRNVPPQLVRDFAANLPGVEVRQFEGFDHRCCWVDVWPALLETF